MSKNSDTLQRFYEAFARLDGATMAACYADDAIFEDGAFSLRGRREVGGMWTMLCNNIAQSEPARAAWRLQFSVQDGSSPDTVTAHWEAHYLFSATGRHVHNIIDGTVRFNDQGLIVEHRDHFDFWRWSRQALGPAGLLLGWTPLLQNTVRKQAKKNLDRFLQK